MEPERLEYFRTLLQERLEEILGEADKTRNDMTGVNPRLVGFSQNFFQAFLQKRAEIFQSFRFHYSTPASAK